MTGKRLFLYPANGFGGGIARHEGQQFEATAISLYEIGPYYFFRAVIATFDQYVGAYGFDELPGGIVSEENDGIDKKEGRQQHGPCLFGHNGALRALEPPHGSIVIEPDYQPVAQLAGLRQISQVPRMDEVEAAIGKDDALVQQPPGRQAAAQFLGCEDFGGYACGNITHGAIASGWPAGVSGTYVRLMTGNNSNARMPTSTLQPS